MAGEWYEGLDEPILQHVQAKKWDTLDAPSAAKAIAQAHLAAQRFIGVPAEQIVRLPKGVDDPNFPDVYKRISEMGAPKDASGYSFAGVEGITEEDAKFVSELAAELKLPVNSAASVAQKLVSRQASVASANAERTAVSTAAEQAVLRQTWGANYDLNDFRVNRVAEQLGWDKSVIDTLHATVGGTKVLNGLLSLASKMSEATFLKGETSTNSATMSKQEAAEAKDIWMKDEARVKKYLNGDMDERKYITGLDQVLSARQ